ncbi:hypothetical protein LEP1GSC021_2166 [Leptospira noguchii str. 1993005606]|uniref:Lipoprotein n=1 Tax=Leptospira noguchii str. 2007001578 TaxID=1049974 RepID=A0ABN0IX11_9LEPT|nr:hypothetical protein [Leptospira noguchii]EMM98831.1 hypothetical protein LEP1GSC035_1555 [Leptospira noguchii str. 2007001578]EPE85704.1 hypothetical protein LEP1GSC021_2166 [Leptospira noguchii str. 1993005606]
MTDQKKYIRIFLILVVLSFVSFCKEKQQEPVEIKDKYALPPNYTGSLTSVPYDFEYKKTPYWVDMSARIEKFFGLQRSTSQFHCSILDFNKGKLQVRITGKKKDYFLKVIYLGNHRLAFVDDKGRGYVAKLDEGTDGTGEIKINYYLFYPLSEIQDTKKIDNLEPNKLKGTEFTADDTIEPEYTTMDECEKFRIEQEKVRQSIDEEHERVKGDLAPP